MNNMEITASYIIVRDLREKLLGYLVLKSSKRMFVCSKKKEGIEQKNLPGIP